jgi:hypothetical protein
MNNDKTLREYAADNNMPISTAHFKAKRGTLGAETYKSNDGKIYVRGINEEKPALNIANTKSSLALVNSNITPLDVSMASTTKRNAAATNVRTDRFVNIESGISPFKYGQGNSKSSSINISEAITLTQLAYYNFATFRNIIDLMTEFSVSNIFLTGGNKKTRDFWYAFFNKIGLMDFQDKWFREFYRSGNVFTYKYVGTIADKDSNIWWKTRIKSG